MSAHSLIQIKSHLDTFHKDGMMTIICKELFSLGVQQCAFDWSGPMRKGTVVDMAEWKAATDAAARQYDVLPGVSRKVGRTARTGGNRLTVGATPGACFNAQQRGTGMSELHSAEVVSLAAWRAQAESREAALMCGANFKTVASPGDSVSPDAILRSVWNGTPDSLASVCSCGGLSGASAVRTSSGVGTDSFMGGHPTEFGRLCLPDSATFEDYPRAAMSENATKVIVAENVAALVSEKYGRINTSAFARDAGIGIGGVQRLLDHETSVGVDLLARVAKFFDVHPWQLMAPNLGQALVLSPAEIAKVREMREPLQPKQVLGDRAKQDAPFNLAEKPGGVRKGGRRREA